MLIIYITFLDDQRLKDIITVKWTLYTLKLLSQSQPNFAEMILGWSPFKIVSVSASLSKMATITKNRNFFKWPKLLYFKPESAQI